jgi:hypothetical protein
MALTPVRLDRRPLALRRGTAAAGILILGATAAAVAGEIARVWRRGSAPPLAEADGVLEAAATAARETGQVVVSGYRQATTRETALLALLSSFTLTFGGVRTSTYVMRRRGEFGLFRSVRLGDNHIHHFVPGIFLALVSGTVSILSRDESLDSWLAIPFGIGAALTLDESALLLEMDDVYWSEEGIVSVQIALATMGALSSVALARRLLRRGEEEVLEGVGPEGGVAAAAAATNGAGIQ